MSNKTFKNIPAEQETVIREVLRAFPELDHTSIEFIQKPRHAVPYGTTPNPSTWLSRPDKRRYTIVIQGEAKPPIEQVLFKNLSESLQRSVVAHELSHVVQFNSMSRTKLLKTLLTYSMPSVKRKLERGADEGAITHGYGEELLAYALYVRLIPGYTWERKTVLRDYLSPDEIRSRLQNWHCS